MEFPFLLGREENGKIYIRPAALCFHILPSYSQTTKRTQTGQYRSQDSLCRVSQHFSDSNRLAVGRVEVAYGAIEVRCGR